MEPSKPDLIAEMEKAWRNCQKAMVGQPRHRLPIVVLAEAPDGTMRVVTPQELEALAPGIIQQAPELAPGWANVVADVVMSQSTWEAMVAHAPPPPRLSREELIRLGQGALAYHLKNRHKPPVAERHRLSKRERKARRANRGKSRRRN